MYKIWSFQHNLLSIITPRNLVLEVSLIASPSMLTDIFGCALFLLENIMKWVFLIFRDSLFAFNHKEIYFNSSFNVFINISLSLPLTNKLLLSANSIGNVFFTDFSQVIYVYDEQKRTEYWSLWYTTFDNLISRFHSIVRYKLLSVRQITVKPLLSTSTNTIVK